MIYKNIKINYPDIRGFVREIMQIRFHVFNLAGARH